MEEKSKVYDSITIMLKSGVIEIEKQPVGFERYNQNRHDECNYGRERNWWFLIFFYQEMEPDLLRSHLFMISLSWTFSVSLVSPLPENDHCVKSVRIRSFLGPYFPLFGQNTQLIQSKCGKMQTRKTPNTDTFHALDVSRFFWKSF